MNIIKNTKELPLIYIIAGEPSGDLLGANLMCSLIKLTDGKIRFAGVGGSRMKAAGLKSLFPMEDISLMGFIEILPHLPLIFKRLAQVKKDINKNKPRCVITIDSPEFNFRVGKSIKDPNIYIIHYVAPTVWAYRPKRAEKISKFLDLLLVLFPFEPTYFEKVGLETTFVGHPLAKKNIKNIDPRVLLRDIDFKEDNIYITILPGSRKTEIKRHISLFEKALRPLAVKNKKIVFLLPIADNLRKEYIQKQIQNWSIPVHILSGEEQKYTAFKISRAALAVSGTVTLELAIAGLPMIVVYRANPITAAIAKRIIKLKNISLGNILLGKSVATELLQENATPKNITDSLWSLIIDSPSRDLQINEWKKIPDLLTTENKDSPSNQAASAILKKINLI